MRRWPVSWLLLLAVAAVGAKLVVTRLRSPRTARVEFPLLLDLSDWESKGAPPGYIAVLPSGVYEWERGFGWSRGVKGFDANTWRDDRLNLDSLHRDAHMGLNTREEPGPTFIIDAPQGRYRLTIVSGAAVHGTHALGLLANGEEILPLKEIVPDGKPRVFTMEVSSPLGRIELAPFTEYGTEWLIAAIELRPIAGLEQQPASRSSP